MLWLCILDMIYVKMCGRMLKYYVCVIQRMWTTQTSIAQTHWMILTGMSVFQCQFSQTVRMKRKSVSQSASAPRHILLDSLSTPELELSASLTTTVSSALECVLLEPVNSVHLCSYISDHRSPGDILLSV